MQLRVILLLVIMLTAAMACAQGDSVAFTVDDRMNDGVYLTYGDLRQNHAISREQIVFAADPENLNFVEKALQQEKFSYISNGVKYTVDPKNVWGFFQNNTFYVNFNGEFYRVPQFGSVSYLVATVLVRTAGFYDPRFGASMMPTYTRETREFIMDFYDGVLMELSMERFEKILSRDKAIYEEFMALGRRKRKEELYRYIRKYNAAHPVYFVR